jgi:hypothetical protein
MKSWFGWTLVILAIAAAADGVYAYRWYLARDGSTQRRAIVIPQSEHQLDEEYAWVRKHKKLNIPTELSLICEHERLYELWAFRHPPYHEDVWFDLGIRKDICNEKSNVSHR